MDRKKLQNTLKKCIYPLAVETHKNSSILVNVFPCALYVVEKKQLDFTTLFNYELSPVPTWMFHDSGNARNPKPKVVLKTR